MSHRLTAEGANSRAATIRNLNDSFRQTFTGGSIFITAGVQALRPEAITELLAAVRAFDDFDENNDPFGEHDLAGLSCGGERIFWKIDYFNPTMTAGSEDPSDPQITRRVLTIMLAGEY